jgi:hypothetical protein
MERVPAALICLSLLVPAGAREAAHAADEVVIYHCTDARGRLAVRDTPCPKGQQQDAREMLRPRDPPPQPAARKALPVRPDATAEMPAPRRVVVVQPPRPLYECVTPDGDRYTSDSGEGRPRYVPLWTLGFPVGPGDASEWSGRAVRHTPRLPGERVPRDGHVRTRPWLPAFPATTLVRDACHALPQAEVCDRLVDRRDALRTRAFNAQQRERDALRLEERGLNARLANDCGIH